MREHYGGENDCLRIRFERRRIYVQPVDRGRSVSVPRWGVRGFALKRRNGLDK